LGVLAAHNLETLRRESVPQRNGLHKPFFSILLEALRREAEALGKLPGAKMSDYRTWLVKNGRTDGMSARLNYLTVIDALEREAESERRVTTGEVE